MTRVTTSFVRIAALAGLATVAAAQSATLKTASIYGVRAVNDNVVKNPAVPAGTAIPRSLDLTALASGSRTSVVAQSRVSLLRWSNVAEAKVYERGEILSVVSPSRASAETMVGPSLPGTHGLLLADPRPWRRYRVEVTVTATKTAPNLLTYTGIDLHDDKRIDWSTSGAGTASFTVTADTRGLAIRIDTRGAVIQRAVGRHKYVFEAKVKVTDIGSAFGCRTQSFGAACGARLVGVVRPQVGHDLLQLITSGARPNSDALMILGFERSPIRLPGSSCLLHVSLTVPLAHKISPNGGAVTNIVLPPVAGTVAAQELVAQRVGSAVTAQASNGVRIICSRR